MLAQHSAWKVEETPEGFSLREQVFAVTSVREHTCLHGHCEDQDEEAELEMRAPNKRSLTNKQLVSALRHEYELHGSRWTQRDVRERIQHIDAGAMGNAGDSYSPLHPTFLPHTAGLPQPLSCLASCCYYTPGAVFNLLKTAHHMAPEQEMTQIQGLAHAARRAGFGIVLFVARHETVQAQVPPLSDTHIPHA